MYNVDDYHEVFNDRMLNKGWSFSRSRFDCLGLMHFFPLVILISMTSAALHRLCRNDRAMIRWICGVKPSDDPSMDELHAKLGICDLAILVREHRLRWFGHVMRSNGEINRVRSRPVPGRKGPGRPKKTWEECVKQDLKVCGLSEAGTQDRLSWRSSVKNSRQEPTPSNGSLLQSMAAPPARRVLGMRTRSFNKTGFDWLIDCAKSLACQTKENIIKKQATKFGKIWADLENLSKVVHSENFPIWQPALGNRDHVTHHVTCHMTYWGQWKYVSCSWHRVGNHRRWLKIM